jgi:hypothetical protein
MDTAEIFNQVVKFSPTAIFKLYFSKAYAFLSIDFNYVKPKKLAWLDNIFYTKERSLHTMAFLSSLSISQKAWI